MNTKMVGTGIVALVALLSAVVLLLSNQTSLKTQSESISPTGKPPSSPPSAGGAGEMTASEETISLTSGGFEPKTITISAETKVVWTNKSGAMATVDSALHPTHLIYPPLNLGQFENGGYVSLVFDKPGTYRYHDHLHPNRTGEVVVK